MPKLCRMRLCSIGYDSARFNDVTLDFTDRQGRPTNSVLWLRNGGGKTSLLSLFFAGVRPSKRDFLGQRADEKIRRLSDYVGPRDHGVVVCEWELDGERGLFDDAAPRYLSGVFYQRKESGGDNGDIDVDRLFFATLVSSKKPELTLEGLPLFTDEFGETKRRTMSGFRRRLRQLDQEHPDLGVFVEDKNQSKFEEELTSRGIDPEVFFYQIRMNEREGGVSERFSFAEDEDFVDFLLEMTFDQRHARQVREQLSTFRQEIVERNEQLKPELEYCQGLVARLHKFVGIAQERADVFRELAQVQSMLLGLLDWSSTQIAGRKSDAERIGARMRDSKQAEDQALAVADTANRLSAVHQRLACQLRRDEVQTDYDASDREYRKAKRQKEIWQAAVPLARVWDARREGTRLRELLQRKLQEFAPELAALQETGTRLANALDHAAMMARGEAESRRDEAKKFREQAGKASLDSSAAGERAAQDEQQAKHLEQQLKQASKEEQLLREQGMLLESELTANAGIQRVAQEMIEIDLSISNATKTLEESVLRHQEIRPTREQAEKERIAAEKEQERLKNLGDQALIRRRALETDVALLRLLQSDHVDMEAASTAATSKAAEELRRVQETILKIGVEAAEDERAIHELGASGLLPPTHDVQSLVERLRQRDVTCWSGWEYIARNVSLKDCRALIGRLPQIATGIIVANSDYDRVVDLFRSTDADQPPLRSRSPVVIAPADAIEDSQEILWIVVGPTSDAHFDKGSGARELNRLLAAKSSRQNEVDQHQQWRDQLSELKLRLQQYQTEYPRGWFSDHRQKAEIAASVLDETTQRVQRLSNQLQALEHQSAQIRQRLQELSSARGIKLRHRDRLEQFQRSFGSHFEEWKGDLILSRGRAEKSRIQQAELRQRASDWEIKSQDAATQAHAAAFRASQFDGERSKLKYFDASKRKPEIAQIEDLRSHYELLLADYDGKVNADSLSQRAQDRDQEAEKQDREFQRVLSKQCELTVTDIEVELRKLPDGVSAQEQLEQTDVAQEEAFRKLGPLKIRVNSADEELRKAVKECEQLALAGTLPSVEQTSSVEEHLAQVTTLRKTRDEHQGLAATFHSEVDELAGQLTEANHDVEKFERDRQRLESIRSNHQRQFDRLAAHSQLPTSSVSIAVKDSQTLVHRTDELELQLNGLRDCHDALDIRQEEVAKDVAAWSRQERFGKLRSSISHRFIDRAPSSLETKAEFDILQLNDCIFQIEQKLQEADKQRDIVIQVLATAVDEALTLIARVSRMSRLPDRLPQAGKQFVKIETKASDNPMERRGHIGELVDELLERGDVGDGLQLIQKAVRRVARRISVRVLHPDLHQKTERVSIAEMRRFSGGERLTSAILLYCALIRLRQSDSNRRSGSSVLILDNPIGTASRLSFLDMQREVAGAMNVQLIYATAVKDLNAVGALENVIRLRNSRADRRTGRHFIEVEVEANGESRQLDAARIVFDSPPSSLIEANSHANNEKDSRATSEVSDDLRPA